MSPCLLKIFESMLITGINYVYSVGTFASVVNVSREQNSQEG